MNFDSHERLVKIGIQQPGIVQMLYVHMGLDGLPSQIGSYAANHVIDQAPLLAAAKVLQSTYKTFPAAFGPLDASLPPREREELELRVITNEWSFLAIKHATKNVYVVAQVRKGSDVIKSLKRIVKRTLRRMGDDTSTGTWGVPDAV